MRMFESFGYEWERHRNGRAWASRLCAAITSHQIWRWQRVGVNKAEKRNMWRTRTSLKLISLFGNAPFLTKTHNTEAYKAALRWKGVPPPWKTGLVWRGAHIGVSGLMYFALFFKIYKICTRLLAASLSTARLWSRMVFSKVCFHFFCLSFRLSHSFFVGIFWLIFRFFIGDSKFCTSSSGTFLKNCRYYRGCQNPGFKVF